MYKEELSWTRFSGSPYCLPAAFGKMARKSMDSVSEGELMKRYEGLRNKEAWNDVCEYCRRPVLLHNRSCTRKNEVENYRRVLDERDKFIERMKIVIRRVESKRVGRMNVDSVTDIELARLYEELKDK